jgi:phosphoglycerol transferase
MALKKGLVESTTGDGMALRKLVTTALFIWGITCLMSIPIFLKKTFGSVTIDQLGFFLFLPDGTVGTDISVYKNAAKLILLYPFAYTLVIFLPLYMLLYRLTRRDFLGGRLAKATVALVAIIYVTFKLGANDLVQRFSGPDVFSNTFHAANLSDYRPTKNLILLYVESLEVGFSDTEKFGRDLNKSINELFSQPPYRLMQAPGTSWTTAGMISSQCGVPLAPFMHNALEHRRAPVLGSLTCLSDVLRAHNYYQAFYVGPELKFSGMDKFYLNHGFDRAWGKQQIDEALNKPQLNTGWGGGVNDDTLLDIAYLDIVEKQGARRPFNVTIITTDNHATHGIVSPRCSNAFVGSQINSVIECTNLTINRFVHRLKKAGVFSDTVLVVMGDHLFMNNSEQKQFVAPKRFVYFNFLGGNTALLKAERDLLTHFDVFPSILALLGQSSQKRIHLGSSLFEESSKQVSDLHSRVLDSSILNKSPLYDQFWAAR